MESTLNKTSWAEHAFVAHESPDDAFRVDVYEDIDWPIHSWLCLLISSTSLFLGMVALRLRILWGQPFCRFGTDYDRKKRRQSTSSSQHLAADSSSCPIPPLICYHWPDSMSSSSSHHHHSRPSSSNNNNNPPSSSSNTQHHPMPPRRQFRISGWQFRCRPTRLRDAVLDGMGWLVETLVYAIGPLLIVLALGIVGILTYTFCTILLPMMVDKYSSAAGANTTTSGTVYGLPWYQQIHLSLHCLWVAFVVLNILYNYFYCVTTKHKGPRYEAVVREQAAATNFCYPESLGQVQQYRHEFNDRMALRIRRRRERAQERDNNKTTEQSQLQPAQQPVNGAAMDPSPTQPASNGMTQRRNGPPSNQNRESPAAPAPPQPPIRQWMLLAPFEWSYCIHSHQPKPPRSHYDHVTKCLVLNLDHYCPWMFNSSE